MMKRLIQQDEYVAGTIKGKAEAFPNMTALLGFHPVGLPFPAFV